MLDRLEGGRAEVAETDDPSFGLDGLRQAPGRFTLGSCRSQSLLYRQAASVLDRAGRASSAGAQELLESRRSGFDLDQSAGGPPCRVAQEGRTDSAGAGDDADPGAQGECDPDLERR